MPRRLSWSAAIRDIARDRAQRPDVRFELSRIPVGLRTTPPVVLGNWRGRSGRHYAVEVVDLADAARVLGAANPAFVALGLDPNVSGALRPVCPRAFGPNADPTAWLDDLRRDGCTQVHIHRLATSEIEARAIAADLTMSLAASEVAA